MTPPVSVRRAGPADADAIVAMARALSVSVGDPGDRLDPAAACRHMLAPGGPMTVLLAEVEGEPAGYASLLPAFESSYASPGRYVADLYVAPAHRRAGIGRMQLAEAAARAAREPGAHLWLVMKPGNAADGFYREIAGTREEMVALRSPARLSGGRRRRLRRQTPGERRTMDEASTRQLVTALARALSDADHSAVLALMSEDVVHDPALGGREIGREAFRWHLAGQARHFREKIADLAVMVAEGGGRAAAEYTLRGTYLATLDGFAEARGQSYAVAGGMFVEIDDGRFSRLTAYLDRRGLEQRLAGG